MFQKGILRMSGEEVYRDVLSVTVKQMPGPRGKRILDVLTQGMQVSERISLYTSGSLTVEASLVIPLFWYAVSGFLYFLLVFRMQEDVAQALADAGRDLGQYAYSIDAEENHKIENEGLIKARIKLHKYCKDQAAIRFVEGGLWGIHLWESSVMEKDAQIELTASYKLRLPWFFLGIRSIPVKQKQICRAWIGYTGEGDENGGETVVYITPYGEKYHHSLDCRYLKLSVRTVAGKQVADERNEDGERYGICENCSDNKPDNLVYITEYGNRYHESLDCSGLKRTVWMTVLSDVEGRSPCQGCSTGDTSIP